MATKKSKSLEKMLAEADAKIRADLKEISRLVRKDFRNQAENALSAYYANYTPKVYNRTGNLMDNAINDDISFDDFIITNKDSYGGWVHFNSYDMDDYDTSDKNAVLSNFMYGIHGKPEIKIESNPALRLMESYQSNYKTILDGYFSSRGFTIN